MRLRNTLIVLAPLSLAACASAYVEPQGPDTATVTIQNRGPIGLAIFAYEVAADCSGGRPKVANTPTLPPGQSVSFKVKGNEAFSFFAGFGEAKIGVGTDAAGNIGTRIRESNCFMPITFTPRPGEKYIARFTMSGGKCSPAMVSTSAAGERKESFRVRDWRMTMTGTGSACY